MVSKIKLKDKVICVVGLGYVGLPLAEAFSDHFKVIGFDINNEKIKDLKLKYNKIDLTSNPLKIRLADFVIIAVPTPVTKFKEPDLSYIYSSSEIVGENLKKNAIVLLESTVYPGVTEEVIATIIEKKSGLKLGKDFKIGYSPERINPGDYKHQINKIIKVVSGIDNQTTDTIAELYGTITNVYKTKDIKTAEAAKVIENIQRDLNIALMNELTLIFHKMGLNINEILDAAATKWNFHRYSPGLVGGHCIPVDPYYLVYKAKEIGYHPQVILSGRSTNDYMPIYIANLIIKGLNNVGKTIKNSKVVIMGLTYKENVADTRESPVRKIISELKEYGVDIYGYDPLLKTNEIKEFFIKPITKFSIKADCFVIAVMHDGFKKIKANQLLSSMNKNPVIIDVRGGFSSLNKDGVYYRRL